MNSEMKVIIERVSECEKPYDDLESPITYLKITHFNRTVKLLNYNVTFKRPIDSNIEVEVIMEKFTNLGWRKISFLPKISDLCNFFLKGFKQQYISFVTALGVTNPHECPIPAGSYSVKEYPLVATVMKNALPFLKGQTIATIILQDPKKKLLIHCAQFQTLIE